MIHHEDALIQFCGPNTLSELICIWEPNWYVKCDLKKKLVCEMN